MLNRGEFTEKHLYLLLYAFNRFRNLAVYDGMERSARLELVEKELIYSRNSANPTSNESGRNNFFGDEANKSLLQQGILKGSVKMMLSESMGVLEETRNFLFLPARSTSGPRCDNGNVDEGCLMADLINQSMSNTYESGTCLSCSIDRFSDREDNFLNKKSYAQFSFPKCALYQNTNFVETSFELTVHVTMLGGSLQIREFGLRCNRGTLDRLKGQLMQLKGHMDAGGPAVVNFISLLEDKHQAFSSPLEVPVHEIKVSIVGSEVTHQSFRKTMKDHGYERIVDFEDIGQDTELIQIHKVIERLLEVVSAGWNPTHFQNVKALLAGPSPPSLDEMLLSNGEGPSPLWPVGVCLASERVLDELTQHRRKDDFNHQILNYTLFADLSVENKQALRMVLWLDPIVFWRQ